MELLWLLIVRYQITDSSQGPRGLLLSWLQRCLPEKKITNLTTDWRDGFLLSSLVNFCDSSLIIDHLWLDSEEAMENVENALQLAKTHFGIPQLLKPEDFVCGRPDESSIMTYLSYFYRGPNSPCQKMLLEWFQEQTGDSSIGDFSHAWTDGRKLALLVHALSNEGFKEHEDLEWRNKANDCRLVMDVADKILGVDPSLSPEQFCDPELNEVERMLYLLQFYFSSRQAHVHELHVPDEPGLGSTVWLDISFPDESEKDLEVFVRGKMTGEVPTRIEPMQNGKRRIKFDAELPDRYFFNVTLGGLRVKGSPFTVDLTPPDPDTVELKGKILAPKVGIPVILTLGARDTRRGKLTVEATGELTGTVPHLIDVASPSSYKVSFIPLQPEQYTVDVRLDGRHIRGSPFIFSLDSLIQPEAVRIGRPIKGIVGEPVTIPLDTTGAGQDKLSVKCVGSNSGPVEVACYPPQDPTEINFTPPEEDTYTVSVFFGNTEVNGSPLEVKIYHVATDAKRVRLIHPPMGSVSPGTEISVGFDASEAGPGEMAATCTGKHYGEVEVEVIEREADCYDIIFTPTESDAYEIVVTWGGDPVPGSPFNMNLVPRDPPNPSKCRVVGFPDSASSLLLTDEEVCFKVDTSVAGFGYLDVVAQVESLETGKAGEDDLVSFVSESEAGPMHFEAGEPDDYLPPTPVKRLPPGGGMNGEQAKEEEEEQKVSQLSIEPSNDNPRIYEVSYTPVQGGNHLLNVYWSDQPIPGSPLSLLVHEPQMVIFGEPVAVRVRTAYKRKHLKVRLQTRGGALLKQQIRMDKITAGDYILVFTPGQPDTYVMHVTAKNKRVSGSPFVVKYYKPEISEERLKSVHVTLSEEKCFVAKAISFVIESEDDTALLDDLSVTRKHTSGGGEEEGGASMEDVSHHHHTSTHVHLDRKKPGFITAIFTPMEEGEEEVEVMIGDKPIPGSPFRFTVELDHAPTTKRPPLAGLGVGREVGEAVGLNLDEQSFVAGNPTILKLFCENLGEGDLTVLCKPSTLADIVINTDPSEYKVYWVTVTPKKAGRCELLVRYGGDDISGSPFSVTFLPRGNAKKCALIADASACPPLTGGVEKRFCVSTKGAGKGKISAIMRSIKNDKKIEVKVDQHAKHHYHLTFVPTEGLNYKLFVRFDDVDINGSPFTILLGSPTHCRAEGEGIEQPWAGRINTFFVDSTNAGPGELGVAIERDRQEDEDGEEIGEEDLKVVETITKLDDFKYRVDYKPLHTGVHWITVKWHGQNIGGSPFKLHCKRPLNPAELSVADPTPITHAGRPAHLRVVSERAVEEKDKLVVVIRDPQDGKCGAKTKRREDNLTYDVTIPPLELGSYAIHATWDGEHIQGSPFHVTTLPPPAAGDFSVEAMEKEDGDLSVKVIGPDHAFRLGELTATLRCVGREGREEEEEEDVVRICPLPQPHECAVNFKPTRCGEFHLGVLYEGENISGSPFTLISTDASQCYHRGHGLVSAQVHQSNNFSVFTENAGPGEIKVEVEADVENEGDILLVPKVKPRDDAPTAYDISYISNFTGHYKVSVFWDIHHIPGSPFEVICCDPARYSIVDPPNVGILGRPVKIGVREATMGPSYEQLTVYTRGKDRNHLPGEVRRDSEGNYVCTIQPPELGKYVVYVQCNGYNVTGSPFKLKNLPPPVADKVVLSGPGLKNGTVGERGQFEIDVSEAGHGHINLRVQGPKSGFNVQMTDSQGEEAGKKVVAEYNPTHPGKYQISVLWAGQHVPSSPFTVRVEEGNGLPRTGQQVTMQAVR